VGNAGRERERKKKEETLYVGHPTSGGERLIPNKISQGSGNLIGQKSLVEAGGLG